jgi:hypothetical protein
VGALRDRARLVKCDLAVAPLTPETAVARHGRALGWNVFLGRADFGGHVLGAVLLQHAMADRYHAAAATVDCSDYRESTASMSEVSID